MPRFDELPPLARWTLIIGGTLMSTFSNSFPTWFQTTGLWLGISSAFFGIVASIWYWINKWREKRGKAKFKLPAWHLLERKSYVPLYEAAKRALDSDNHRDIVQGLEPFPEDTIRWYCHKLKNKTVIYGRHLPSARMEKFEDPNYDFGIENGVVIATERYGPGRWEQLEILESDLRAAIGAVDVAR